MRFLKKIVELLIVLILLFLIIKIFFPYYRVKSLSMEPTIKRDQIIFVSKLNYLIAHPQRGDIVMFYPNKEVFGKGFWIHRILAVEGDEVNIKNGTVKVNGIEIKYPFIEKAVDDELIVPKNNIFQKGDNPNTIYGLVDKELIIGKVILVF